MTINACEVDQRIEEVGEVFFYIAISVFSIVIVCMLIGFIKFRRGEFTSNFVPFIMNDKAVKALKSNKKISAKTLEQISNLVIAQVAIEGMVMASYLILAGKDQLGGSGHLLVLAIVAIRFCFGYLITRILEKDADLTK
ncbi:hypothetical protein SAMN02982927_01879 [Sporolactobacillus nakayamae]|uniref:DUF2975 domain-containing protein n=1 Tax=Sporolactobacillus nakayamae TaxID=269670 RepID=A0A1I2SG80_9BACL|nr:hypothetical protein SAMN02982927_01879 [Sporolactobacillus nakayamae]